MNIKKRQEIINLMPWYNLGKLSDADKAMVDTALSEDSSLKEQLSLDQDIMSKVLADPKLLDRSAFAPSSIRLNKVLAQIDDTVVTKIAEKQQAVVKEKRETVSPFAGIKSFFTDLISGSSHSFTYAVFAALTAVQLALLLFFVVPSTVQERSEFTTASNGSAVRFAAPPVEAVSGLVLRITIEDNASIDGLTFNSEKHGKIAIDLLPSSNSSYRIRLNGNLSSDEIEDIKNELLHKTENVKSVDEEPLSQ